MSKIKNQLVRQIDITTLIVYYFSTIVGVGIFIIPMFAARLAGPASIIAWICVLACAYPFAMIYAHISQRYQVSGSIQRFIEDSLGIRFGQTIALFLIFTAMFGNSLLGFSASRYLIEILEINSNENFFAIGVGILIIPILFNLLNVALSSRIQLIALIALLSFIVIIVLTSIPYYNVQNLTPFAPKGYGGVLGAITICFYSVVGWENVDALAEEVKDPIKTYKKAIKISLLLISLFYLTIVTTVLLVLDTESLNSSNAILTILLNITLGKEAAFGGGLIAVSLLLLGANAWIMGTSRLIFSLARDNVLPHSLAKISAAHIPYNAVLIQYAFYILIGILMFYGELTEDTIVEVASLNYLLLYSIVFGCGVKHFTTGRLKFLSFTALIIAFFFLIQSANMKLAFSFINLIICASYIFSKKTNLLKRPLRAK